MACRTCLCRKMFGRRHKHSRTKRMCTNKRKIHFRRKQRHDCRKTPDLVNFLFVNDVASLWLSHWVSNMYWTWLNLPRLVCAMFGSNWFHEIIHHFLISESGTSMDPVVRSIFTFFARVFSLCTIVPFRFHISFSFLEIIYGLSVVRRNKIDCCLVRAKWQRQQRNTKREEKKNVFVCGTQSNVLCCPQSNTHSFYRFIDVWTAIRFGWLMFDAFANNALGRLVNKKRLVIPFLHSNDNVFRFYFSSSSILSTTTNLTQTHTQSVCSWITPSDNAFLALWDVQMKMRNFRSAFLVVNSLSQAHSDLIWSPTGN